MLHLLLDALHIGSSKTSARLDESELQRTFKVQCSSGFSLEDFPILHPNNTVGSCGDFIVVGDDQEGNTRFVA